GGRPVDRARASLRRLTGPRSSHGPDRPGQESQARQAHLHLGARDWRRLHRARCRRRRGPRLSHRKARRAMTSEDWFALAIVLVCLLLSAFFAASETALTASSRASMHRLEKQGNRRAAIVNRLLEARERMIGALLFGNNAV